MNSNLGKPEFFLKMLSDIPFYELRINLMTFIEEFTDIYTHLLNPLNTYEKISKIILDSRSLKKFFRTILAAGNFLNTVRIRSI